MQRTHVSWWRYVAFGTAVALFSPVLLAILLSAYVTVALLWLDAWKVERMHDP